MQRRTGLEKALMAVLGVCGAAIVVSGIVVFQNSDSIADQFSKRGSQDPEVCLTPECALAAASIIEAMDITADPCDDFYRFACGGWIDENVIPDGRNKWGRFYELRGAVDDALKGSNRHDTKMCF